MTKMIIKVKVQDFAKWKFSFDELSKVRKEFGSMGGRVYRSIKNPNEVTIIGDWASEKKGMEWAQSPELKDAMERGGVVSREEPMLIEEVEQYM